MGRLVRAPRARFAQGTGRAEHREYLLDVLTCRNVDRSHATQLFMDVPADVFDDFLGIDAFEIGRRAISAHDSAVAIERMLRRRAPVPHDDLLPPRLWMLFTMVSNRLFIIATVLRPRMDDTRDSRGYPVRTPQPRRTP